MNTKGNKEYVLVFVYGGQVNEECSGSAAFCNAQKEIKRRQIQYKGGLLQVRSRAGLKWGPKLLTIIAICLTIASCEKSEAPEKIYSDQVRVMVDTKKIYDYTINVSDDQNNLVFTDHVELVKEFHFDSVFVLKKDYHIGIVINFQTANEKENYSSISIYQGGELQDQYTGSRQLCWGYKVK